ncbi:unnamed protein product [Meloidogyne enterolobii]|uniref:Uncharacterized protein n=1 Tax=Meloidogyne enterolobii TaxID=390850 RepID=A0ACB1AQG8_MELEN
MHFDFKGAPPKPSYFISLLPLLQNMGFNGLLIEWEDMFPYKGRLANAINGDAYTMDEIFTPNSTMSNSYPGFRINKLFVHIVLSTPAT